MFFRICLCPPCRPLIAPASSHIQSFVLSRTQTVGRFATRIANLLQGKHKPTRQSNLDEGDTVVIVNCEKVHFTGKKWSDKLYRKHSGFPGGLKEVPAEHLLAKHPEQILFKAIYGMLPKNKHRRPRMNRLKL